MSKKLPNYPEDFSPDSLSWVQVSKKISDGLADAWFSNYEAKPVDEIFTNGELDYDEAGKLLFKYSLVPGNDFKIIPEFASALKNRSLTLKAIRTSTLGMKLLENIKELGLLFEFDNKILLNDDQYIEVPEEVALRGNLIWATYFDSRFMQSFEIYEDAKGNEFVYWFSTVLYGTRPPTEQRSQEVLTDLDEPESIYKLELTQDEIDRGVLTFEKLSSKIHLPWLSKVLFYLGETPFPSSFVNMSRSLAYDGLNEADFPIPYLDVVSRDKIFCAGTEPSKLGTPRPVGLEVIAPQQVRMGWLFSASDLESQRIILTTITDGLVRINSYLQDGYLNHNTSDSAFYFDAVVASDNQLEYRFAQNGKQGGYSRWIPTTETFDLLLQTRIFYSELQQSTKSPEDHELDFAWLTDEGVGNAEVAASINDAIYYFLIPRKQWGGVAFYAQIAIALDVPNQSTNARSNWGIANFIEGDYEKAKLLLHAALEREDKFAEDEASYYLSVIYEKEGDKRQSEIYRQRCELAGGYTPTFI
jgi:hypothetical protein